ncbi:hypothetical protein [Novosphingobium sp.]|uniref:hypothetical protein n=1 Tax=Novosphingobium sp. TaxID=1874826 RepID=UPI0025DCB21A|nr:hypothetical protein [Novosphingobium sp.]
MRSIAMTGVMAAIGMWAGTATAQDSHDHTVAPSVPAVSAAEAKSEAHNHTDMTAPKTAQLLPGYGDGGFAVSGASPQAQAYFSNALELHAAFAHRAAVSAAKEAVRLDPACAMCKWGAALIDGPTINYGKDAKERVPLLALARQARSGARSGGAKERALTDALLIRYQPGDTGKADRGYAAAMAKVAGQFPQDNEIAVLAADAAMVSAFVEGKDDYDHAALFRAIALLEPVLARAPRHTPAIHFYIHATEVIGKPALAETYADALPALAPRASHLVHMPSHTWYWVGRYQDAADTNRRAVEIGKDNARALGIDDPKGVWDLPYHAHNVIYGLGGALMAGDSRTALDLARPLVERSADQDKGQPWSQLLAASGYFALARFDPAAALAAPEPKLDYLKAARRYARGEALVWQGDLAGAGAERNAIPEQIAKGPRKDWPHDATVAAEAMLGITRAVLDGRIAMAQGRFAEAATAFRTGALLEETKEFSDFSDPPAFWYPVRRDLAAALLAAGDAKGAQREAQASLDLRKLDPVAGQILAAARLALAKGPAAALR